MIKQKIMWSLALFIATIITFAAIVNNNMPLCIVMILINLLIYKFGDKYINEKYNKRRAKKIKDFELAKQQAKKEKEQ
ncbi:hypothetical protein Q2T76_02420 [Lactobacillus sp. YT155]|uniref:hypothetical protein n=1 Tax=Lactobacillus sp. YT155 TaxID=3060955 RepID=UPI00265FC3F0|nr:hypothetical protein [Lactobacillus sp. YT155]MDO1604906.1 hypothetical protein [Lactobacillus sp. YT155]